jgi:CDP-glucose 4,6-dehydratase
MESMETLKGKKILVTGGTGFIGSHIVEKLVTQGVSVAVVDIVNPEVSYFSKQKLQKKVVLHLIDIAKKNKIATLFASFQPDYVFHLAAEAIVANSYQNPYKTFQTNVMGTVSILEAARKTASVKGVIVASSDKAYGKTTEAYTENSPLKGDHPYDVSKSATDLIAQTYYKTYGLPVVITRFGNVYGEGDIHMDRIIPGICEAVIKQKPLLIRSDGKYVRDYVYVEDVAEGYLFLLKNIEKVKGEAFNFSSKDTYSVMDLIKKAEKVLKTKIDYKILNTAKNEIPYQHLDSKKIRRLGWKTKYSLTTTFPHILNWYKIII